MNYSIAHDSRIGGREINQDRVAWLATGDAVLLVLADGMGGHLQGEVAAQLAVDILIERFRLEARTRLADPVGFLAATLRQAHATIVRYAVDCRIPLRAAPRTTCIACVVQDGQATWAHAGDSRLYLIHDQPQAPESAAHTRDHSVVQRMLDEGSISRAEAAEHPLRHRVFSCLGGDTMPYIEVSPVTPLQDGDLIVLCSDGAWVPLGDALAAAIGTAPLATTVPQLLEAAERTAGPGADNLTLIALRWEAPVAGHSPASSFCDTFIGEAPFSDAEIDSAVAEIRHRSPRKSNGASS